MKKTHGIIILLAVVGLVASVFLTQLHYGVAKTGFEEKSFCHVSEFMDCDSVIASRYSEVKLPFGMIPNSEIGIIYYLFLALAMVYAVFSKHRKATLGFLFVSVIFACVYSGYMAYLSLYELNVLCLLCASTYVVNILLLLLFPSAMGLSYAKVPSFLSEYTLSVFDKSQKVVPHLLFFIGFSAVSWFFFNGLNPAIHAKRNDLPPEVYVKKFLTDEQTSIDVSGRPIWGNPDAKVTIVEFSDFQCPFCRRAAFTLKPTLKENQNDVKLVYVNYPLDNACNPALPNSMHPVSCFAAKAAICADEKGKFWPYHDLVFKNQKKLSRSTLIELAKEIGLNENDFEQCMVSERTADKLKKDVDLGNSLTLQGTPTVYVNGRQFRDWLNPDRFRAVINELKK